MTTPDRWSRFLELQAAGASARKIADELRVTPRTVLVWRRVLGVSRPAPVPHTPEERALVGRLLADGCSRAEAARTVHAAPRTVRRWYPDAAGWDHVQCGQHAALVRRAAL